MSATLKELVAHKVIAYAKGNFQKRRANTYRALPHTEWLLKPGVCSSPFCNVKASHNEVATLPSGKHNYIQLKSTDKRTSKTEVMCPPTSLSAETTESLNSSQEVTAIDQASQEREDNNRTTSLSEVATSRDVVLADKRKQFLEDLLKTAEFLSQSRIDPEIEFKQLREAASDLVRRYGYIVTPSDINNALKENPFGNSLAERYQKHLNEKGISVSVLKEKGREN